MFYYSIVKKISNKMIFKILKLCWLISSAQKDFPSKKIIA